MKRKQRKELERKELEFIECGNIDRAEHIRSILESGKEERNKIATGIIAGVATIITTAIAAGTAWLSKEHLLSRAQKFEETGIATSASSKSIWNSLFQNK